MSRLPFYLFSIALEFFRIYTVSKGLDIFLKNKKNNKVLYVITYGLFTIILRLVNILYDMPALNITVTIILIFMLTFNYSSRLPNRFMATFFIVALFLFSEIFLYALFIGTKVSWLQRTDYTLIFLAISEILQFLIILISSNLKNIKENIQRPKTHWFCLFFFPMSTSFIIGYMSSKIEPDAFFYIIMCTLLFINLFVFYLYDSIIEYYLKKEDFLIEKKQSEIYKNQLTQFYENEKNIRAIHHDIQNHLAVIGVSIVEKNNDNALDYIERLKESINFNDFISFTGKPNIDSLINYKIEHARLNNICFNTDINISNDIFIDEFDFIIILGNLIDNALDASDKLNSHRIIKLSMYYSKSVVTISLTNNYIGCIKEYNGKFITSKSDNVSHGIGLENVKRAVNKYNGDFLVDTNNNKFNVTINLYI